MSFQKKILSPKKMNKSSKPVLIEDKEKQTKER